MMPAIIVKKFAPRIRDCENTLNETFNDLPKSHKFEQDLTDIKFYYIESLRNAESEYEGRRVVEQYEKFTTNLLKVRNGDLSAKQAQALIDDKQEDKIIDIVINNIFTVCELLFWVAAAAVSYATCLTVGIPLLFLQPLLGVAVTAGTGLLMFVSLDFAGDCFEEFQSSDLIDEEYTRETNAISFFPPKKSPSKPEERSIIEIVDEEDSCLVCC
jgi:hypothetical protein